MKASRSRFPSDAVCSQSPTVSLKGSLTFPSTVIVMFYVQHVQKRRCRSDFSPREAPGSATLYSGIANRSSTSPPCGRSMEAISLGSPPSAHSQQYANVLAENPVRHCLAGSARNRCQSSGPVVGVYSLGMAARSLASASRLDSGVCMESSGLEVGAVFRAYHATPFLSGGIRYIFFACHRPSLAAGRQLNNVNVVETLALWYGLRWLRLRVFAVAFPLPIILSRRSPCGNKRAFLLLIVVAIIQL
jgi:hypothetical protein